MLRMRYPGNPRRTGLSTHGHTRLQERQPPKRDHRPGMMGQLRTMAAQDGISVETAAYRYGWQNDLALAVDRIREAHPNAVTTSAVTGDRKGRIDFAGELPSSAQSEVAAFQAEQCLGAVPQLVTSFENGVITSRVLLSGEATSPNSTLGGLRELAGEKLVADKSNMADYISVTVEEMASADELGGEENASEHLGGEVITACTSGFAVKTSYGGNDYCCPLWRLPMRRWSDTKLAGTTQGSLWRRPMAHRLPDRLNAASVTLAASGHGV